MTDHERFEAWRDEYEAREGHAFPGRLEVWHASRLAALEEACAAIKAEDDRQNANDYMLDSDDCINVIRALSKE